MKFRVGCHIVFGLVALLQFGCGWGKRPEKDQALMLQMKVENLIEKILRVIQDYYHQIRTELKCIPDDVPDTIIGTLKKSIDCVDQNERNYDNGRITPNLHKKAFLKCFSDAKTEVEKTITSINPDLDYCPENMTEKTYQINVTTTFTKTFHINIKNGLEVMKKQVHLDNQQKVCVFNHGEGHADTGNQTGDGHGPENNLVEEDHNHGAGQSKGKDLHSKEPHGKGHHSKEPHGKGHHSKEHHGKGHESESGSNANSGNPHGDNASWNENEFAYKPDQQVSDQNDEDDDYVDDDHYFNERPDSGNASNEAYGDDAEDGDGSDGESVSGVHNGNGDVNHASSPGSAEGGGKESQTEDHHAAVPDAKELHGKGEESKEHSGKGSGSAQQPDYVEEADADDHAEGGEVLLGKDNQNIVGGNVVHHIEVKNNTKDKSLISDAGPIIDDDDDSADSGIDHEKVFFPETTSKGKLTSRPDVKLATDRTAYGVEYADVDEEPEDSNYGDEYFNSQETEKNPSDTLSPEKSPDYIENKLGGQPNPMTQMKQRIQIRPRNQFRPKPKKPQQSNEGHKFKLPKMSPKKVQPETVVHQAVTSLAQSFLRSDF